MKPIPVVAVCALLCFFTSQSNAQQSTPSPSPTPPVNVIYTGRLLGHFRLPSVQKIDQPKGCPARSDNDSEAAKAFLKQRELNPHAILVGTGDNFAPQLEARVFVNPPDDEKYAPGNKELYFGDGNQGWIRYDKLDKKRAWQIAQGLGTIPTDNVGCFLRAAKFDAIVPGKHDFYFGPERVRQFARLLASTDTANGSHPVQMLGANLVLKTSPLKASDALSSKQADVGDWPDDDIKVTNLKNGKTVYPWFTYVKILLKGLTPDEIQGIRNKKMFLCLSDGGPNQMPADFTNKEKCKQLNVKDGEVRRVEDADVLYVKLPSRKLENDKTVKNKHIFNLLPATNYGICTEHKKEGETVQKKVCLRFSTHTPFFYFPHDTPQENTDSYTDPDPYVLKDHDFIVKDPATKEERIVTVKERVAIFGVVDPSLSAQVGILNLGYQNTDDDLTTSVSAEDPADALLQQLDYFESRHENFTGLKVLLAQMNPQRARGLAAHLPQFQMVVSAADTEQATSDVTLTAVWDPDRHKRSFLAVPAPYLDSRTGLGSVHVGTLTASERDARKWELATREIRPIPIPEPMKPNDFNEPFWKRLNDSTRCLPQDSKDLEETKPLPLLKLLTLCAVRDHTSAAAVLLQKRDFFDFIPVSNPLERRDPKNPETAEQILDKNIQHILDRLIWKGDLVRLLLVRGSTLKKALKQSEAYANEETASLSISVDRGRHFEMLGIHKENNEYFINDLPIKDGESYPIATTDYIGASDTGYPELIAEAQNPRTHPAAFSGALVPISGRVCRMLFKDPATASKYCLGPIVSKEYLDRTTAKQITPNKEALFSSKFNEFFASGWPNGATAAKDKAEAIEQTVQRRDTWRLTLQNFSFGFTNLDNNHSDEEVEDMFDGISPSVVAKEKRSYNFAMNGKLSRSSHKRELFVSPGFEYEREYLGDDPSEFDTNQIKNRAFVEAGYVFWRSPGRRAPNIGTNVSLYMETPLMNPFTVFSVTNDGKLKITRQRDLTVMPRVGFRWQGKANSAEIGIQAGKAFRTLDGYRFITNGVEVKCEISASESFKKCIEDPANGLRSDSEVIVETTTRPRAGIYWKLLFSRQIFPKATYQFEDTTDFFTVKFDQDTPVDTRFRSISKHSLNFEVWPSFSIGPTFELLIYQNKINRDILIRKQFGFKTTFSFDLFNRRELFTQVQNKP